MAGEYYLALTDADDRALVGGKAHYLGRLLHLGAPVPGGGAITTQLLYDFLVASGREPRQIAAALAREPSALEAIADAIESTPWPDEHLGALEAIYRRFEGPICVRSSAVNEDGAALSFAGVYRSHVNIGTFGEFVNAVRDIWRSAFDGRAQEYAAANQMNLAGMAVVVQEFIDATASGVAFLQGERLFISAAYGLCEGVVTGRVPCDTIVIDSPRTPARVTVASKERCHLARVWPWFEVYDSHALRPWVNGSMLGYTVIGNNEQSTVTHCAIHFAHGLRNRPVLDEASQATLVDTLYGLFGRQLPGDRWDIEWSLDRRSRLFILQARPVTAAIAYESPAPRSLGGDVVHGHPIAPGSGTGPARHISSTDDLKEVQKGDVLVMDWIPDTYLGVLSKASALVISDSTPLSHCAIIARERKIPCVGGVVQGKLAEGRSYTVDGTAGVITPAAGAAAPARSVAAGTASERLSLQAWLIVALNDTAARPQRLAYHLRLWEQQLRDHQGERIVEAAGVAALCDAVRSTACFEIAVRLAGCAIESVRRQPREWRLSAPDADRQMLATMSTTEASTQKSKVRSQILG